MDMILDAGTTAQLYSEIEKPFEQGYVKAYPHQVYWEVCGNPNGYPIVFVHGGPGAGCSPRSRRFFDPNKWKIILFDQRGCGRSQPLGCLQDNTTQDLISDIRLLLQTLKIKKAAFFGGSWGSTLILNYAIGHLQTVSAMILRGIWLGERREVDYYLRGGVRQNFPEVWERFAANVPMGFRDHPAAFYFDKLLNGTEAKKKFYAYEWAFYESKLLYLKPKDDEEIHQELINDPNLIAWALIEAHYCFNYLFIKEGYVIQNAKTLDVPTTIVHGQYDMLCFPESAWRLYRALPGSAKPKLIFPLAGHYSACPANEQALLTETDLMFGKVYKS